MSKVRRAQKIPKGATQKATCKSKPTATGWGGGYTITTIALNFSLHNEDRNLCVQVACGPLSLSICETNSLLVASVRALLMEWVEVISGTGWKEHWPCQRVISELQPAFFYKAIHDHLSTGESIKPTANTKSGVWL